MAYENERAHTRDLIQAYVALLIMSVLLAYLGLQLSRVNERVKELAVKVERLQEQNTDTEHFHKTLGQFLYREHFVELPPLPEVK